MTLTEWRTGHSQYDILADLLSSTRFYWASSTPQSIPQLMYVIRLSILWPNGHSSWSPSAQKHLIHPEDGVTQRVDLHLLLIFYFLLCHVLPKPITFYLSGHVFQLLNIIFRLYLWFCFSQFQLPTVHRGPKTFNFPNHWHHHNAMIQDDLEQMLLLRTYCQKVSSC